VNVRCPHCRRLAVVRDEHSGRTLACPYRKTCGRAFRAPPLTLSYAGGERPVRYNKRDMAARGERADVPVRFAAEEKTYTPDEEPFNVGHGLPPGVTYSSLEKKLVIADASSPSVEEKELAVTLATKEGIGFDEALSRVTSISPAARRTLEHLAEEQRLLKIQFQERAGGRGANRGV
jgi:hypothetical protein